MVWGSYGSYIYQEPSKLQLIFWPYTDTPAWYSCKKCRLSVFMEDFDKVPPEKIAELRQMLHSQLVHYLVAVGSIAVKDQADLAARFKLPSTNSSNTAFLTSVKALLAAGEGQREELVKAGMTATLLEDLARMVAEFEEASEAARTARRDHIGARADLQVISAELLEHAGVHQGDLRTPRGGRGHCGDRRGDGAVRWGERSL